MKESIDKLEDLAGLYDEFFLIEESAPVAPKEKQKIRNSLTYYGKNTRGILFIYLQSVPLKQEEHEMMKNMLERAAQIPYNDIIHCPAYKNVDYQVQEMIEELKPKLVVVWGGESTTKHKAEKDTDRVIIYNHEVSEYVNSNELKREMWQALEPLLKA
jgi:hypothetical protein